MTYADEVFPSDDDRIAFEVLWEELFGDVERLLEEEEDELAELDSLMREEWTS